MFLWICIFVKKFGAKWMTVLIDEDMNILHFNTLVMYTCIVKVEYRADFSNFFRRNWKISVMYACFGNLMFWIWSRLRWNSRHLLSHRKVFSRSRLLSSFWHSTLLPILIVRKKITKMDTREYRETRNVEQALISRETSSVQSVCELFLGVQIFFTFDLRFQIDSVEQRIWRNAAIWHNAVSSSDVSHHRTSSFDSHFYDSLKKNKTGTRLEKNTR